MRTVEKFYIDLLNRYPALSNCGESIVAAYEKLVTCYENAGKLMVCGNGGSAADAEHIVGELMKGFLLKREMTDEEKIAFNPSPDCSDLTTNLQRALPAISLCGHSALMTAYSNDVKPELIFAQQVFGFGKKGDCLLALSTSGNSENVVNAVRTAKKMRISTLSITGEKESKLSQLCDVCIRLPATETYIVQEYTLPVYHALCAMLEYTFFDD